jgi:hypothetical protein
MDDLLVAGFQNISTVDVSATALQLARQDGVNGIEADIMFPPLHILLGELQLAPMARI